MSATPGYVKFLEAVQRPPITRTDQFGRTVDLIPFDEKEDALAIVAICSYLPKRAVLTASSTRNESIHIQTPKNHLTLTRTNGVFLVDRKSQTVDVITREDFNQHYSEETDRAA